MSVQPGLHRQHCTVAAPTQLWLDANGRLAQDGGFSGLLHGDTRMLCQATVTVNGFSPEEVTVESAPGGVLRVRGLIRGIEGHTADPAVEVLQTWTVTPGVVRHSLKVGTSLDSLDLELAVDLAADFTDMAAIRLSRFAKPQRPEPADDHSLRWHNDGRTLSVSAPGRNGGASASAAGAAAGTSGDARGDVTRLVWHGTAGRGRPFDAEWQAVLDETESAVVAAAPSSLAVPAMALPAGPLRTLLKNSLDELDGLRMATRRLPDAPFMAAGAPWYFTLFGRDSLWAARFLLPLDAGLATGTLRTLAEFQGSATVPDSAEEPGKILHELRAKELVLESEGLRLPPVYYGAVDSTSLWLCLLGELWRTGKADDAVRALLPAAQRAAQCLLASAGPADGDGLLRYQDVSGHGLSNQGWKDSGDAMQFRDGRLAAGPIALAEVQGYAHQAATSMAELLDALGEPGAGELRDFAAALAQRFREHFWVEDAQGPYPAMALDGRGTPLDIPGSNMGHLLGTGILGPTEARHVAARLLSPELFSGFGLHTLSHRAAGFWPFSYHCGSVWSHDTAIAVRGLLAEGFTSEAKALADGLLAASAAFGYRLPELFAGVTATESSLAVPYPASCHPQAWSSASAVVLAQALGGLR
ncbi:glycogen debranching N-terminal domain-containing protein [Arthrobacter sp. S39]|uniref:glycogen debranching N-terminal domain-containing protein n=1 Tax=Arthrobacter sp. S39 TaxID=2509720 RepID=UPI00103820A8|nr:glycogen debranching N-terminal domain-containing protein [Arthrobacter sp. S39]TAP43646.1 amylo-alpha-1,6-glucosidase [Arthrobacter sp. S39]